MILALNIIEIILCILVIMLKTINIYKKIGGINER